MRRGSARRRAAEQLARAARRPAAAACASPHTCRGSERVGSSLAHDARTPGALPDGARALPGPSPSSPPSLPVSQSRCLPRAASHPAVGRRLGWTMSCHVPEVALPACLPVPGRSALSAREQPPQSQLEVQSVHTRHAAPPRPTPSPLLSSPRRSDFDLWYRALCVCVRFCSVLNEAARCSE